MGKRAIGKILMCLIAVVLCFGYVGVQQVYADIVLAPENLTVNNLIVNGGDTGEKFLYTINLNVKNWAANGTTGKDTITCGHGDDYVNANSGNDTIYGYAGNDYLDGGAGIDEIYGGIGNDTIYGGEGNDYLCGGGGSDKFCFGINDGNDFIEDISLATLVGSYDGDSISISEINNLNQLRFSKFGNHLVMAFTTGTGKITVSNYFNSSATAITLVLPDAGNTSYSLQTLTSGSLGTTSATVLSPLSPPATLPSGANATMQIGTKNIQYTTNLANAAQYEMSNLSSGDTFSVVQTISNSQKEKGWKLDNIWGNGSASGANINLTTATASGSLSGGYSSSSIFFQNSREQCTVTFNANGHGSTPQLQTVYYNEKATKPADPSESGWIFGGWYTESECINEFDFNTGITGNIILYAKWTQDQPQVVVTNPISKRLLQNNTEATPDMTFTFSFTQQSEWDGVSYVSAATPIADKSVTITSESERLTSDEYAGDLTGKKLYQGKTENVLSDFNPQAAGTYCYLVKEDSSNPIADVTYTGSQFIMLVEVEDSGNGAYKPTKVTNILYKDSAGKTKTDYTTPPSIFDEKQELIFYNNYGTTGGTTPTGIITNILPFIVIGGVGVGGLSLYAAINVKRRKKDIS